MTRTNILTTRIGIWFRGELADEEWLADRLKLTQMIGIPAFENVTTPWHWVWLTCKEREDQVREVAPPYVHIALQTDAGEGDTRKGFWRTEVPEIPGDQFLVARLDSDDAYLPGTLDKAARRGWEPSTIIDWGSGWRYDIWNDQMAEVTWKPRRQGHFLAVTQESRADMLDFGGNHLKAREGRDHHVRYDKHHHWLQVVHGQNVWGKWRNAKAMRPEVRDQVLSRFGVEKIW